MIYKQSIDLERAISESLIRVYDIDTSVDNIPKEYIKIKK